MPLLEDNYQASLVVVAYDKLKANLWFGDLVYIVFNLCIPKICLWPWWYAHHRSPQNIRLCWILVRVMMHETSLIGGRDRFDQ